MQSIEGLHSDNYHWERPDDPCGSGVVVIAGSSGTLPVERARLLAACGLEAIALRWFGGPGQNDGPFDIELELFVHVLNTLARAVDRVSMLGASFGAEAALNVAARASDMGSVIAIAPTTHVWPGQNHAGQVTSHWTWNGAAVPFVPLLDSWVATDDPPAFRRWYELSLEAADDREHARIPVEEIASEVVLVAGGDDQVWPSADWAQTIATQRADNGRSTNVITRPDAGHRPVLPGESPATGGRPMRRGGTPAADALLGADAWPHVIDALGARIRRP